MDRLQKQSLLVSLGLHGLLVAVLLVGPGFLASQSRAPDLGVLDFIPDRLVDEAFSGGGTPNAKPPPPAPAPAPPVVAPPEVRPPAATPPAAPPAAQPASPPAASPAESQPVPAPAAQPTSKRRLPEVSTELVTRKTPPSKRQTGDAEATDSSGAAASSSTSEARRQALAGALSRIGEIASSSTEVGIPGPGGATYANYAQWVKTVYTTAWIVPPDVEDEEATTVASVTIARDGTVLEARIIRSSGNAAVDASVRRTLERVRSIGYPFPAGAKEDKRTFTLRFNLKAKRLLG